MLLLFDGWFSYTAGGKQEHKMSVNFDWHGIVKSLSAKGCTPALCIVCVIVNRIGTKYRFGLTAWSKNR